MPDDSWTVSGTYFCHNPTGLLWDCLTWVVSTLSFWLTWSLKTHPVFHASSPEASSIPTLYPCSGAPFQLAGLLMRPVAVKTVALFTLPRHVGTVPQQQGHCPVCAVVTPSPPSLVKQPWDCSSLTVCEDCRRKGSLLGMAGKERETRGLWGRCHSPAAATNSHISASWSRLCQRRSQQMCCFSSISGRAVIVPTLWS